MNEISYTLLDPIIISEGHALTIKTIILHAPKRLHLGLVADLQQILSKTAMKHHKENSGDVEKAKIEVDKSAEKLDEKYMWSQILKSSDDKGYLDFCNKFSALLKEPGIGYFMVDTKLTPVQGGWENKLSIIDYENIMGEYLINFLLASQMRQS